MYVNASSKYILHRPILKCKAVANKEKLYKVNCTNRILGRKFYRIRDQIWPEWSGSCFCDINRSNTMTGKSKLVISDQRKAKHQPPLVPLRLVGRIMNGENPNSSSTILSIASSPFAVPNGIHVVHSLDFEKEIFFKFEAYLKRTASISFSLARFYYLKFFNFFGSFYENYFYFLLRFHKK